MKGTAYIDYMLDGRLKLTTPYNLDFVIELKNEIPPGDREWVPSIKAWVVSKTQLDIVETLCKRYYAKVVVNIQSSGSFTSQETPFSILYLTPEAPSWLVKRVWKLLAQEYHPDRNKDGLERMKMVNEAYDEIKKIRGE